jgi:hypothetical protein
MFGKKKNSKMLDKKDSNNKKKGVAGIKNGLRDSFLDSSIMEVPSDLEESRSGSMVEEEFKEVVTNLEVAKGPAIEGDKKSQNIAA